MFGATNDVYVDFLILADRAEVINNKLYMMGGGWDQFLVVDFAQPVGLSLAVAVLIPWQATNLQHTVTLAIQDADARDILTIPTAMVTGRPPQMEAGAVQRVPLAFPAIPLTLPGPGSYVVSARINGVEKKRITFRATQAPRPPLFPGR